MVNKKAAMEMTMGTVVTIVLMIAMLIVLLFFINKIRSSGTNAIDQIDESIKTEMGKLFSEDDTKKVVIYPASRNIYMEKEDSGGFGFSIRNKELTEGVFTYAVSAGEILSACQMDLASAESLIGLGKTGTITIPSGDILEQPILVKFVIPETAPLCMIRYNLDISKDGQAYLPTVTIDLEIK